MDFMQGLGLWLFKLGICGVVVNISDTLAVFTFNEDI